MRNKALFVLIPIAVAAMVYLTISLSGIVIQKCPEDYTNDDAGSAQKLADLDKWTGDFYDAHPGATLTDWSLARHQYWVDNKCTKALQAYQDYKDGKVGSTTVKKINDGIQEAVNSKSQ